MKHLSPENTLNGQSPRPLTAKTPYLASFIVICLLFLSGILVSCSPADLISSSTVETTLFLPDVYVSHSATAKAGYEDRSDISRLDIFVFNDDGTGRLDSYCSTGRPETPYITVTSGTGDKIVVIFANCTGRSFTTADFWSYESLENVRWDLKDEDPLMPVMSGECQICAGAEGFTPVQLTPVLADVCLDFIKCDFSGRGYKSKTLANASVYLTNISGSSEIMRQNGFRINDLKNDGGLDRGYLAEMKHPEMIFSEVTPGQWSPVHLYCYPNDAAEGVLGSPHTRLVVQGEIDGKTYYYPIDINQEGFGYSSGPHGVGRNIKYSYSLLITRKGSTDPDTPVGPEEVVEQGWISLLPGQYISGKDGESVHVRCEVYPEDTSVDICVDDLEYDVSRGIYTYRMDEDGLGVTLDLKGNGTGMFTIDAGAPVNKGFLVIVVVNP